MLVGQVGVGAALSLLLVPVVTVPLLVAHHRRFGRADRPRPAGTYLLVVYATVLVAVTLFPLPAPAGVHCAAVNIRPLAAFGRIAGGDTPLPYLGSVALFVPLGLLLRRAHRWPVPAVVGLGFAVSLFLELTQFTGAWRLYHCAYRAVDVDDLIANTAGALTGALLAPLWRRRTWRRPTVPPHPADDGASVLRRGLATGVDLCLSGMLGVVRSAAPASAAFSFALALIVFVLVPTVAGGATPGKWLTRLRVHDATTDTRPAAYRLLLRAVVLYVPWLLLHAGAVWLTDRGDVFPGFVVVASLVEFCYPVLPAGMIALRRDRRPLHDLLAGTRVVRAAAHPTPRPASRGPTPPVAARPTGPVAGGPVGRTDISSVPPPPAGPPSSRSAAAR